MARQHKRLRQEGGRCKPEVRERIINPSEALTSAIIIRRKAFAIDASTPVMSNSIDRCDNLSTDTFKAYSKTRL